MSLFFYDNVSNCILRYIFSLKVTEQHNKKYNSSLKKPKNITAGSYNSYASGARSVIRRYALPTTQHKPIL